MSTLTDEQVEHFASLFSGYQQAYGTYLIRGEDSSGKVTGRAQTLRGTPTHAIYRAHLEGAGGGLGIIMLREDNTVFFGAIDYDVKTMDHAKAEAKIEALGLPLVLCRSKSGGGHFYCFMSEPVPATIFRDRLAEWTALLGMAANTEQFPKQTSRYDANDVGNWINLPYFNADDTNRYAIKDGKPLDLAGFLELAESRRQTKAEMSKSLYNGTELFEEGPPCLQTLEAQGGFVQGTKKEGMFNVAVYLRKRYPDDWQRRVDEYNGKMANILSDEVQGIIKQVGKKAYSYKCKLPPINGCCNRRLCRTRQFGVGETDIDSGDRGFAIGALTRYEVGSNGDEPYWAMEVNGKRVMVTTAQLYSRDEFNRACMSQANVIPVHTTPVRWLKFLNDFLPTAEIVPLPEDAGPLGQLWEHIVMFLTQGVQAPELKGILLGVPYREEDKIYFRSLDLMTYLKSRRVDVKSPQQVWELLRKKGGDKKFTVLDGKGTNVWSVPAPHPVEVERAVDNEEQREAF